MSIGPRYLNTMDFRIIPRMKRHLSLDGQISTMLLSTSSMQCILLPFRLKTEMDQSNSPAATPGFCVVLPSSLPWRGHAPMQRSGQLSTNRHGVLASWPLWARAFHSWNAGTAASPAWTVNAKVPVRCAQGTGCDWRDRLPPTKEHAGPGRKSGRCPVRQEDA
jgi:hypothetical protein